MWLQEGLDLKMSPYQVIETGNETGMIEVVPNSETTAAIQKVV
jgi:phosphatidylinositol-4,5-bisphosphate 3-kinase